MTITLNGTTGITSTVITETSGGNVGIGTSLPNEKLTVVASTGGTGGIRVETQYGAGYFGNYNNYPAMMYNSSGLKPVVVYDTNNHITSLHTDNTERMRIDSAGRVTMPYQPAFRAWGNATTTGQVVKWNVVPLNIGGHYNSSTGRFTVPVNGTYLIILTIFVSVTGTTQLTARTSGGSIMESKMNTNEGAYNSNSGSVLVYLSAGDYVEVNFDSGSVLNGPQFTYFAGYLIG